MSNEKLDRMIELERIAKNKYCECVEWDLVIDMLNDDDKAEYYKLAKELNMFGEDYNYEYRTFRNGIGISYSVID